NGEGDALYVTDVRQKNRQNDLVDASLGCFGYGDGGGGCTYAMVERLRRLQKLPGMPQVKMGKAREFFTVAEQAAEDLPVWDGEMYYENHRGTFTSQAFIKKNNRRGEFALRNIELIGLLSGDYPAGELDEAWHLLLQNQFHDILPGTSIHEAVEDTRADYQKLDGMYAAMKNHRLAALTKQAAGKDPCVVVWNFHTHPLTSMVETAVPEGFTGASDENGKPMKATVKDGKLSFIAEDVPGLGYKIFTLTKETCEDRVTATKTLLENEYLRVVFDENGLLDSVFDKENGRETLCGKGNLLTISHDKPIHESAWNLESDYKMKMCPLTQAVSVEVTESSPVKGEVTVVRRFNESTVTQKISLKAGCRTLDFATEVDWHEREKVLKAAFPVNVRARYSTFEIAHGAIERPTYANNPFEKAMFECCAHKWTDLSEGGWGVSLLNDCKYGYDLSGNVLRITLMRGPVCPDPKGDLGLNTFTYSLYPHAGAWRDADTVSEAFRLNLPLEGYCVTDGNGEGGEKAFLSVSAPNVIVDAVKRAQDGDGVILRMYEAEGRRGDVTVILPEEVKHVTENNLMEEAIAGAITHEGSAFTFTIKPFEVRTFRIEM
ncbi:MAG: alpha-mannosidase, partial [Clostridia bacterium]|nr:alpha-mannosidase [Clostridia bacterium]